jgi:hypothetical protein
MKKMSMRDRMLAVIQGKEHDQVPFAMYEIMFPKELAFEVLGKDRIGIIRFSPIYRVEHPNCSFDSRIYFEDGNKMQHNILHTPKGDLEEVRIFEPAYDSSTARKHYIATKEDYEFFWSYLDDCIILENYEHYLQDCAELGETGLAKAEVERSPYQQLWIEWTGLEALSYHIADFPDHVAQTIERLNKRARQTFKIAYNSPAPFIDIPDNITAPAIGPKKFRKYVAPLYDELAGMLAERNAPLFIHMDGLLKPLQKEIAQSGVIGMDSFSPIPDCDMTVSEALEAWPEKILWVNFPGTVHMQTPEKIRDTAEEILESAGHSGKLQIQISENVPLNCWRTSFPVIVDAIERFGKP